MVEKMTKRELKAESAGSGRKDTTLTGPMKEWLYSVFEVLRGEDPDLFDKDAEFDKYDTLAEQHGRSEEEMYGSGSDDDEYWAKMAKHAEEFGIILTDPPSEPAGATDSGSDFLDSDVLDVLSSFKEPDPPVANTDGLEANALDIDVDSVNDYWDGWDDDDDGWGVLDQNVAPPSANVDADTRPPRFTTPGERPANIVVPTLWGEETVCVEPAIETPCFVTPFGGLGYAQALDCVMEVEMKPVEEKEEEKEGEVKQEEEKTDPEVVDLVTPTGDLTLDDLADWADPEVPELPDAEADPDNAVGAYYMTLVWQLRIRFPREFSQKSTHAWYMAVWRWCKKEGIKGVLNLHPSSWRTINRKQPINKKKMASELKEFRENVQRAVREGNIPKSAIVNMDETSVNIFALITR